MSHFQLYAKTRIHFTKWAEYTRRTSIRQKLIYAVRGIQTHNRLINSQVFYHKVTTNLRNKSIKSKKQTQIKKDNTTLKEIEPRMRANSAGYHKDYKPGIFLQSIRILSVLYFTYNLLTYRPRLALQSTTSMSYYGPITHPGCSISEYNPYVLQLHIYSPSL